MKLCLYFILLGSYGNTSFASSVDHAARLRAQSEDTLTIQSATQLSLESKSNLPKNSFTNYYDFASIELLIEQ